MRQSAQRYLFAGVFAPVLSLDELCNGLDDETESVTFDITDSAPLPDVQLECEQALLAVDAFVASLSPRDQEIIRRVFWDGETQTEVAARLGVSKMAISKTLARIYVRGRLALAAHQHWTLMH